MMTHTPGPWTVEHIAPYITAMDKNLNAFVVAVISKDILTGDPLANARLIAAAPELLKALKEATEHLRVYKAVAENHIFDDEGYITVHKSLIWDDNDQSAFDKACAAIERVK